MPFGNYMTNYVIGTGKISHKKRGTFAPLFFIQYIDLLP
jgi:hypothetical protein